MGFADESAARRVLDVLPKRFGKYGLTIHPGKTRLLAFGHRSTRDERSSITRYPKTPDQTDDWYLDGLRADGSASAPLWGMQPPPTTGSELCRPRANSKPTKLDGTTAKRPKRSDCS
jgi:hypothetical protein